jgi:hypothetical protein
MIVAPLFLPCDRLDRLPKALASGGAVGEGQELVRTNGAPENGPRSRIQVRLSAQRHTAANELRGTLCF